MIVGKWALITGASGGIGLDLAYLCAQHKMNLILVSRNELKLKQISEEIAAATQVKTVVVPLDLSDKDSAYSLYKVIKSTGIDVEVLINNAGVGEAGLFMECAAEKISRMLQLNMVSLAELTRLFGADMVQRKSGRILNVASVAAYQPITYFAAYAASKSFVLSFSAALSEEMKGTGVTVTCLAPGATATGFAKAANMEHSRVFNSFSVAKSKNVASQGFKAMMAGKRLHIVGLSNRISAWLSGLVPTFIVLKLTKRIML